MRVAGGWNWRMDSGARGKSLCKQGSLRAAVAFVLCVLMVDQPLLASTGPKRGPTAGSVQTKGEGRVLHALNRLTFGPRPGDVSAVQAMGLSTWFEMQLNPSRIDDSALEARLAQFPAMQLPQGQLMARYPGQQEIRRMEQRGMSAPSDPVEHAIYADQMAFYKMQQAKQAAAKEMAAAGGASDAMAGDSMMETAGTGTAAAPIERRPKAAGQTAAAATDSNASGMAPDTDAIAGNATALLPKSEMVDLTQAPDQHVEKLFKDLEAVKILNLPPEERMRRVIAMSPPDFLAFRQSLSGAELAQFSQGLTPQQRETFAAMQNSTRMIGAEEMQVRLMRDVYSERQLEAVMTDFWLNHFNVYVRKNQNEPYLIPAYEREAIRPHALGKFEDLLVATAKSPAMLMYLDNWQSIGPDSAAATNGPRFAKFAQNPQVKAALKDRGLNENYG
ncbi:MAG TPA: DUF1800 family protein, partial [Acidobacteriaceae bacterium]